MHPLAASAGAISASLIRSALCHRGSSFSSSFSTGGLQGAGEALAPLDLLLVLQDSRSGGGLRGVLTYSPDVLEPHMMDLLAEHFQVCAATEQAATKC